MVCKSWCQWKLNLLKYHNFETSKTKIYFFLRVIVTYLLRWASTSNFRQIAVLCDCNHSHDVSCISCPSVDPPRCLPHPLLFPYSGSVRIVLWSSILAKCPVHRSLVIPLNHRIPHGFCVFSKEFRQVAPTIL